jgi:ketosteroid isomerase-like protein
MSAFSRDELERAFQTYIRTGAAGEDWDAWADLFTEDCLYFEHAYGTMHGREAVRAWIKPVMAKYGEIYTVYEWHLIDDSAGRVIFYMQNRRDHPGGLAPIDFPGITLLEYAGDGKWKREEDYWAIKEGTASTEAYAKACREHDPDHPRKRTRLDWGTGPEWTKGGRSYDERPQVR